MLGFDVPIIRLSEEVGSLLRLLRFVWNVATTFEYRSIDLCCREDPVEGLYYVKDTDAWWRELNFEGRQCHRARGPRFVSRHSLEMLALPSGITDDFFTPSHTVGVTKQILVWQFRVS